MRHTETLMNILLMSFDPSTIFTIWCVFYQTKTERVNKKGDDDDEEDEAEGDQGETDKHTDRQADRQTDRQTEQQNSYNDRTSGCVTSVMPGLEREQSGTRQKSLQPTHCAIHNQQQPI